MDKFKNKRLRFWFTLVILGCSFVYAFQGILLFIGYGPGPRSAKPSTFNTLISRVHIIGSGALNRILARHLETQDLTVSTKARTKAPPPTQRPTTTGEPLEPTSDPYDFATTMEFNNISHLVLIPNQLETIYVPSLNLVNTLEGVRDLWGVRTITVLPYSYYDSVVARTLEYISQVYHTIYGCNTTVVYVPDQYTDNVLHFTSLDNSAPEILAALMRVFKQDNLSEKYVFNVGNPNRSSTENPSESINTTTSNVSLPAAKPNVNGIDQSFPLPLDLCLNSNLTTQECLKLIRMEQSGTDDFVENSQQENYIFTTYFTSKSDPQRGKKQGSDNLKYVRKWFLSLKHLGLKAVIFHDGLGTNFTSTLQEAHPGKIFFEKVSNFGHLSTNDYRFKVYYEYLARNPKIEKILCTDVSDVVFHKDPFELMTLLGDHLYVGQDSPHTDNMGKSGWLRRVAKRCAAESVLPHYKHVSKYLYFLNAGVIGGSRATMLRFLEKTTKYLGKTKGTNCNMLAVNYVAQRYFHRAFFTGAPLTGVFKGGRFFMSVYISHK